MKTNALLIFTRNPELGKVKTRLAKTIGDVKALAVYNDLLLHTMQETQQLDCDKFVFYDSTIVEDDIWATANFQKKLQAGGDLGQRMRQAFEDLFELGYQNCIIIGSDLFDLKAIIIEDAFEKMLTNDVVMGPAEDGGYYLLGLKKSTALIFENKKWGKETIFQETLKDLKGQQVGLLQTLNDIDTFEDLQQSSYSFSKLDKI
ncbi:MULTISPECIES: TIGR04282 family arsenosugar biosynthesis glycosyltransferase [unclassified Flavobacterium]|uniref:TIGR04282 family arsenosugar biosynthesis glycosyltransferase n=1 Tax=unclassified Flavobacterium TaxID=196869 RepID=UPI003F915E20